MKQFMYGLISGLIVVTLIGFMLFDNFKTKLVVGGLQNTVNQIVQVLNQAQQRQPQRQPTIQQPEQAK